jgi:CubicO group peptidase (beta-lactamase class C family)
MAYKLLKYCLHSSFLLAALLFYQVSSGQTNFKPVEDWVKSNLRELGGRAVLMIYKDGRMIYSESFNKSGIRQKMGAKMIARKTGKDARELMADYDENSRIGLASCSKWLSAALVMTFADEGKLKLTDTVGKFLPVMSANGKGNITIEQCLSHTTGIKSNGVKENKELIHNVSSMEDAVKHIAIQPMEALPGEAFAYSSIGLQLAAAVIEKISGKDFETLFAERIAKPCAMTNTDFGHKNVPLPAGGGQGTAGDYMIFLQMILNKGVYNGQRVLSENSVRLMQENHIAGKKILHSPAQANNWGYGFGEWTMEDASFTKQPDAVSSPGMFGSFPWVDNKKGYSALLFSTNLKFKGRHERYSALKALVDKAISN